MTVAMDVVGGVPEVVVHLVRTGHHLWTDRRVIVLHRAECRLIEDTGVGAEVEEAVVDEGATEDDNGRTHDLAAGHHGEACRARLTVGHHPEHRPDEVGEEATTGGIVHQGGAGAEEVEEGEVPAIAPMAATGVEAETADEKRKSDISASWKSLLASVWSSRSSIGLLVWRGSEHSIMKVARRSPMGLSPSRPFYDGSLHVRASSCSIKPSSAEIPHPSLLRPFP
jgi:hypothetical protein